MPKRVYIRERAQVYITRRLSQSLGGRPGIQYLADSRADRQRQREIIAPPTMRPFLYQNRGDIVAHSRY